jgi:hypothetical protein
MGTAGSTGRVCLDQEFTGRNIGGHRQPRDRTLAIQSRAQQAAEIPNNRNRTHWPGSSHRIASHASIPSDIRTRYTNRVTRNWPTG